MPVPLPTTQFPAGYTTQQLLPALLALLLLGALLLPLYAHAQDSAAIMELQTLTDEREMLTRELEQYKTTIMMLHADGTPAEQSSNPAVKKLAQEMVSIRQRLIQVTEREVTLLQEQIIMAGALATVTPAPDASNPEPETEQAIESKPLRVHSTAYDLERDKENVKRLHALLAEYYTELQESARTLPTDEEMAQREAAKKDAETLARIPFSIDKVRLNGSEGSTALTQITRRLSDPNIPESRRDIAPICGIKTRLFGKLIGSENRSLKPVGKHHYVARIRLQPGDTTLRIQDNSWDVRLPQNASAGDYMVTFYQPPGGDPELHVFAVDDLLAEDEPHIPAWLPAEVNLKNRAG
jgi:hypothetical protein